MTPEQIRDWDLRARGGFTYRADEKGRDIWRSHADQVLAGQAWSDDCDGLATTVLDLIGRAADPKPDRYMIEVSTTGGEVADHLVAVCRADDASFWVVGDTLDRGGYRAEEMRHRAIRYHHLGEIAAGEMVWRGGAPWEVT